MTKALQTVRMPTVKMMRDRMQREVSMRRELCKMSAWYLPREMFARRALPPFLGDWRVNVEGREPVDFFRHLFPIDLIAKCTTPTCMLCRKGKKIWK